MPLTETRKKKIEEEGFLKQIKSLKMVNTSTCLFCKRKINNKNKSKEHIIADWLLEYLNIQDALIRPTIYNPFMDKNTLGRNPHPMSEFKEGRVCAKCNNGWMSELESETMEILKQLMSGRILPKQLSETEKLTIAKWSFKTAIVLNSGSNFYKLVPLGHYEMLYRGEIPLRLLVTVTTHNHNSRFFLQK
jgi:hypothetical protein